MANVKQAIGARTAVTVGGLATLANGAYATSNAANNTANQPLDLLVELSITPGTVAGNKQALLFALASLDGANYQTGANATDEGDMTFVGALPLNSNAAAQTKVFSTAAAFGGVLPPYVKYVVKNDSGAAFTAGTINTAEVSATVI
jgi:hypothetical protein